ncbi:hypothetical protein C0995_004597 [Termitomyces sp. Mi166|nr:hypothetical protein C0995_004597 [Termitomyces sp. Mi166\
MDSLNKIIVSKKHLLSPSEHEDSLEEGIHQPPDAEQVQQDQDEITHVADMEPAISVPESDSHVEELSDSGDFDEPVVDDIEEDDQTAAATCAHAQTILDAHNGTQYSSHADTEEDTEQLSETCIESLCVAQKYIHLIQNASLDEDKLDTETLHHLRHPIEGPVNIISPDYRLSLEIFTVTNSSEATYNQCHTSILQQYPDSNILTFYKVKQLVAKISGIVPVMDDMCINSCHAFTDPYANLDACSICKEP